MLISESLEAVYISLLAIEFMSGTLHQAHHELLVFNFRDQGQQARHADGRHESSRAVPHLRA